MQRYFSYIRVSTAKQGEHGVSLQEQQEAIDRYAQRNGLDIVQRFEERETAAKRGRPVFTRMLKLLRTGKSDGVIIHKIDRSARNLKDWADLGELIDHGIAVHFANESLDLHSRGGRLSADIQAVIAADYIRNLREETRKGFYGRLKQGVYPLPAPVGYIDEGRGKPKTPDPDKAPLVRRAFELYATGHHNLDTLGHEAFRMGLRNRNGGRVTRNGLSVMLNNPFYIGLIRLRRTGETFQGAHQAIITPSLFDRVQHVLTGKFNARSKRYDFVFRKMLTCEHCEFSLIGELQKGHVYYRCHTRGCPTTTVRHDVVHDRMRQLLEPLQLDEQEREYVRGRITRLKADWGSQRDGEVVALRLRLRNLQERLGRLTDAFVDGHVEKALFEERKTAVLLERRHMEEQIAEIEAGGGSIIDRIAENLELAETAYGQYEMAEPAEKRELVRKLTSNRVVDGRNVELTLLFPFDMLADRFRNANSAPFRDIPRTWSVLFQNILDRFISQKAQPPSERHSADPSSTSPG